ncbi:hypothetical protein [Lactococcus phage P1046]|uniref:Holin n=2 Tax=Fremauxvirus CHPC971 TaxID=2845405 RepID=A0A649V316_9CAUD|nr:hypothetical protein [Lactococcus phage P1046]
MEITSQVGTDIKEENMSSISGIVLTIIVLFSVILGWAMGRADRTDKK